MLCNAIYILYIKAILWKLERLLLELPKRPKFNLNCNTNLAFLDKTFVFGSLVSTKGSRFETTIRIFLAVGSLFVTVISISPILNSFSTSLFRFQFFHLFPNYAFYFFPFFGVDFEQLSQQSVNFLTILIDEQRLKNLIFCSVKISRAREPTADWLRTQWKLRQRTSMVMWLRKSPY